MKAARNSVCPCGSGRKYKRCCLAERERAKREARFDDAVGRRIQDWSSRALGEEISAALEEFVGPDRPMDDDELQIFAVWFHNDRELAGGGTPAERYAARTDLPEAERAAAARIAAARLGFHRVLAVEPGSWILLEDIVGETRTRVRSRNVSRDAVRWDILLGRVMEGDPSGLWGPTRVFEPADEPELLAELDRLAAAGGKTGREVTGASQPRRRVDPLRALGGLRPGEPIEIDITVPREVLVRDRPKLPRRAIVFEAGPIGESDSVPVATVRLEGAQLHVEAMSEERLDRAIELVAADFGDLAELSGREVVPIEQRLDEQRSQSRRAEAVSHDLTPAEESRLLGGFMTDRMLRWLDEPHPLLDAQTPREAVTGDRRAEVVRLVRGIENGAERARRRGQPFADVASICDELGVEDELAA
ncbi:MAG: SEC-C domain-containing protein [Solirubrobacterales bacterium]